jgi:hypothetical protein
VSKYWSLCPVPGGRVTILCKPALAVRARAVPVEAFRPYRIRAGEKCQRGVRALY